MKVWETKRQWQLPFSLGFFFYCFAGWVCILTPTSKSHAQDEVISKLEEPMVSSGSPTDSSEELLVALIDTEARQGVAPEVAKIVDGLLRSGILSRGYKLQNDSVVVKAARSTKFSYPPSQADLWRVALASRSARSVFATLQESDGRYRMKLTVASVDGSGPKERIAHAPKDQLAELVRQLLEITLPEPGEWDAKEAERLRKKATRSIAANRKPRTRQATASRVALGSWPKDEYEVISVRERWEILAGTDIGFVPSAESPSSYLQLFSVTGRYRVIRELVFGIVVGGGVYPGFQSLVGNMHFGASVEWRLTFAKTDVTIPLRIVVGMLPYNGPYFRFEPSVLFPFKEAWLVEFHLLNPSLNVVPHDVLFSLGVGASLGYSF